MLVTTRLAADDLLILKSSKVPFVEVTIPEKVLAVIMPEVLALKVPDNVTPSPTLPVPSKDTV